jgi:hypothetical protein
MIHTCASQQIVQDVPLMLPRLIEPWQDPETNLVSCASNLLFIFNIVAFFFSYPLTFVSVFTSLVNDYVNKVLSYNVFSLSLDHWLKGDTDFVSIEPFLLNRLIFSRILWFSGFKLYMFFLYLSMMNNDAIKCSFEINDRSIQMTHGGF